MNKLPIETKEEKGFKKWLNFFKKIFTNKRYSEIEVEENKEKSNVKSRNIRELYRVDIKDEKVNELKFIEDDLKNKKMEDIINMIEKDPQMISALDLSMLKNIDKYYVKKESDEIEL